ncbi:MAG: glycosyltransferase [Chloroflexi bacterium]|nr:glycosyltransferase [Chloroflexota bacterium]
MNRPYVPQPVLDAAHARLAARAARDWPTADRLRDEIEAAGWKVVDVGTNFRLEPVRPPTMEAPDGIRYGHSGAVPSRLDEPASRRATLILVATDQPDDLDRALAGLRAHGPAGLQVVVVADAPDDAQASRLPAGAAAADDGVGDLEVIRTSIRLGWAAALNAGFRRAAGDIVIWMDTSVEPTGDVVTPLVGALGDPGLAVAGAFGLRTADLRRFEEVTAGDAAAIEGYLLAFRRADAIAAGPLDEGFRFYRNLDIWWSLVLRDGDEDGEGPPRRAVAVDRLPLVRHEHRGWTSLSDVERARLSKRNFYRLLDRFRGRDDLVV